MLKCVRCMINVIIILYRSQLLFLNYKTISTTTTEEYILVVGLVLVAVAAGQVVEEIGSSRVIPQSNLNVLAETQHDNRLRQGHDVTGTGTLPHNQHSRFKRFN